MNMKEHLFAVKRAWWDLQIKRINVFLMLSLTVALLSFSLLLISTSLIFIRDNNIDYISILTILSAIGIIFLFIKLNKK